MKLRHRSATVRTRKVYLLYKIDEACVSPMRMRNADNMLVMLTEKKIDCRKKLVSSRTLSYRKLLIESNVSSVGKYYDIR
jgi:hypothetical protein